MKNLNRLFVFLFSAIFALVAFNIFTQSVHADTPIDFGSVTADNGVVTQGIPFTNDSGDGSEWTPNVEAPGNSAFTINDDQCSGQPLEDGDSCTVTVDFEPSGQSGNVSTTMDISYTSDQGSGDTVTYDLTANVTGSSSGGSGGNQEQAVTLG